MISGLLTLILLTVSPANETASGLESLLAGLVPEAGEQSLHFTETRDSPLMDEPLTVSGRFWRDEDNRLVRETLEPKQATQRLGERMVVIERPDRPPRRFSLSRAPELAVLRHALVSILGGDAEALRRHFEHELIEGETGWQLVLRPRDQDLAGKVDALSLSGRAGRIERFELSLADGEVIVTELRRQP